MKIKGVVIHSRIEFVREHFGDENWQRVLDSLPEEDKKLFADMLLKAQWYPFEIGERLDKAIVEVLGEGDSRIFEMIGAKSAKRNLLKEHKSFFTPGDPQAFMSKTSVIYKSYYDTGRREYKQNGPRSGVMTTYDAETFSVPDCLTVIGWYKEALRMCGARNVRIVEEECRALGGECCRYSIDWD